MDTLTSTGLSILPSDVLASLAAFEITSLTEIQRKAYSPMLSGQNVIGISETGSGKTLAYLLPLATLLRRKREVMFQTLILAPSKELALQISQVATRLFEPLGLKCAVAYGGTGKATQAAQISKGVHVIIGTPGRLLELYADKAYTLKQCQYLVLDEADRMMELGMGRQLGSFLEILPRRNQKFLFSATLPDKVAAFVDDFVEHPLRIEVQTPMLTPESIDHRFVECNGLEAKLRSLVYLLETLNPQKAIIFIRSKILIDPIKASIKRRGIDLIEIHSNKDTNTRINGITKFRAAESAIMMATDVSSRWLDIPEVELVINFNMPHSERDFIHRVGRTGRMGAKGMSISLLDSGDKAILSTFSSAMQRHIKPIEVPERLTRSVATKEESILQDRVKDSIKRATDPTFKGGFHKKENLPKATSRKLKNR